MKISSKVAIALGLLVLGGALFAQSGNWVPRTEPAAEKDSAAVTYKSSLGVGATPTISANQAQIAALTANPGASALNAELDGTGGQLVYSVELNTGAEVKVDAGNGKILSTEVKKATGEDGEGKEADVGEENNRIDKGEAY